MSQSRMLLPLLIAVLLSACGQDVPREKSAYIGDWTSATMTLSIAQGGRVKYKRDDGSVHTSVEGPLKGFEGDDFSVGIGFIATKFVVSEPPHETGSRWMMTVDGVELTRR